MASLPTGTITFLFTDIEGSTQRWEQHRAAMQAALARHDALLRGAIEAHGGHVFKTVGDAFCAAFASATAALAAALDTQRALAAEDWSAFGEGSGGADFADLRVRIGLHTGVTEVRDGDYFGPPLNRTARLMSAGHGGQILLSLATQQLVRDGLPPGCALRDLGLYRLKDLRHSEHIYQLVAADLPDIATPPDTAEKLPERAGPVADVDLLPAECPYRGLHAFREADARFFFGRELFAGRLVDAASAKPMVGVIGPSGSGKSSVVFAGMVPALRGVDGPGNGKSRHSETTGGGRWTILSLRPGAEPFHALAGVLVPLLEGEISETARLVETRRLAEALADGTLGVHHVVARAREKREGLGRLLFIADQFEELYTLCPDGRIQRAFQDLLFDAVHAVGGSDGAIKLALTLRADFMGHALAYRPFADAIQDHNVILGPMNHAELTRAITRPAELQGRAFESGLVERILGDVGEEAGSLPLLEFALTKLWEQQEAGWLTHAAYEATGRVEGAVARHADGVYEGLGAGDRALARRVFVQLVRPGEGTEDTRRVATKDELGDAGWGLVRRLADARLIVTNRDEGGREVAEVVHEALIRTWGRLAGWMGEDRRFRMWQERLRFGMKQWEESGRDEGALLRGVPLAEAEQWVAERGGEVTAVEREFVAAGVALRTRREAEREALAAHEAAMQRRVRNLLGGIAAVAVLGLGVSLWFATAESKTRRQSQSLAMASASQALLAKGELDLALSLALEAVAGDDAVPEAELALAEAAYAPGTQRVIAGAQSRGVYDLAFSPDGRRLASAAWDRMVRVWDVESGQEIHRFEHKDSAESVAFSPDGRYIMSGSWDSWANAPETLAVLWDAQTGAKVREFTGHTDAVQAIAFSPDGSRVVTGSEDATVRLWDVASGAELRRMDGHSDRVNAVAYHPGKPMALSGGGAGEAILWDLDTGKESRRLEGHSGTVNSVAFSPDGRTAATGGHEQDGTVRLWDVETGAEIRSIRVPGLAANDLTFSPDGLEIIAGLSDASVRRWEASTGLERLVLTGHADKVQGVAVHPDGSMIASADEGGAIRIWHADSPAQLARFDSDDEVWAVAVSPDGSTLLSAGTANNVTLWNLVTGEQSGRLIGPEDSIRAVAFSPSGTRVAAGSNGKAHVWNLITQELVGVLSEPGSIRTQTVAFSPDGRLLLTASQLRDLRVWDFATGEEVRRFSLGDHITSAVFSPDGRRILAASGIWQYASNRPAYWDVASGEILVRLDGHEGFVQAAAISPDGRMAVTGSVDRSLRMWDLSTGAEVARGTFGGPVQGVAYSPDGRLVAVGTGMGEVALWDIARRAVIRRYPGHAASVLGVAFSPDGRRIVSGSSDHTLRVWAVDADLATLTSRLHRERFVRMLTCAERDAFRTARRCDARGTLPAIEAPAATDGEPSTSPAPTIATSEERPEAPPDDPGAPTAAPSDRGEASVGSQIGELRQGIGESWALEARAGEAVRLQVAADRPAGGVFDRAARQTDGLLDPALTVRAPDGTVVAHNADILGGLNTDAAVEVTWPASGRYRVDVTSSDGGASGAYTLSVEPIRVGPLLREIRPGRDDVSALAFGASGETLLSASRLGAVNLWDIASGRQIGALKGHYGLVKTMDISEDGLRLLTGGDDKGVTMWDLVRRKRLWRFDTAGWPRRAYFAAGDTRVAYGAEAEFTIPILDARDGREVARQPSEEVISTIAISPDGSTLLTFFYDNSIWTWDVQGQAIRRTWALQDIGHTGDVVHAVFTPDGRSVVTCGTDGLILRWDTETGEELTRYVGHRRPARATVLTPDGQHILSLGDDQSVRLWNLESGTEILRFTWRDHAGSAATALLRSSAPLAVSPDGRLVAAAGADGVIRIWRLTEDTGGAGPVTTADAGPATATDAGSATDGATGASAMMARPSIEAAGPLAASSPAAAATQVAGTARSGTQRGEIALDVADTWRWEGQGERVIDIAVEADQAVAEPFDPEARIIPGALDPRLVVRGPDGAAVAENDDSPSGLTRNAVARSVEMPGAGAYTIEVSGYDARMSGGYTLAITSTRRLRPSRVIGEAFDRFAEPGRPVPWGFDITPDGQTLVVGSGRSWDAGQSVLDNPILIWDLSTGAETGRLNADGATHLNAVRGVAVSPDGRTALAASADGQVVQWDLASGKEVRRLVGHKATASGVAFSPDGGRALSTSDDDSLILWDLADGRILRRMTGTANLHGVAFLPDGRAAVTTAQDGTVTLWDLETGLARWLGVHASEARTWAVAVSPDGARVLSGDNKGGVVLWDAATGAEIRRLHGHAKGWVYGLDVSLDGRTAVSAAEDGTARLWDLATGAEIARLLGHEDRVFAARFTPDGRQVVTSAWDGTLRVWDLNEIAR